MRNSVLSNLALRALLILLAAACLARAAEPLKIYYIRHGEGGHNVVGEWKDNPKSEWPPYVGNENAFTPKGEQQVAELTQNLGGMKFDLIAVSPKWRARNTILPFLRRHALRAEIWPELTETKSTTAFAGQSLPPARPEVFRAGKPLNVDAGEADVFVLREDGGAEADLSAKDERQAAADAAALAERVAEMIRARFAGSGKTILLVGHGNSGVTLARVLAGAAIRHPENTGFWAAEEQPDGSFKLTSGDETSKKWRAQPATQKR